MDDWMARRTEAKIMQTPVLVLCTHGHFLWPWASLSSVGLSPHL